jgi:diaminopimelate epimerase
VITIEQPRHAQATAVMGIRNPDGSQAGACGNATRCVAQILMAESGQDHCVVETLSGLLPSHRHRQAGNDSGLITVDMGPARFDWQQVPLAEACDTLHLGLEQGGLRDPVAISMGNPHAVFFVDDLAAIALEDDGPKVETHALFPQRTNVEAVQVLSRDRLRMRVWERGAGITEACGSGACAVMAAAVARGLSDHRAEVILDGGSLFMEWRPEDGHVLMTGPVATAFQGLVDPSLLARGKGEGRSRA